MIKSSLIVILIPLAAVGLGVAVFFADWFFRPKN